MEWLVDSVFKMFTYKAIDLSITKEDIEIISEQVKSLADEHWHFNSYRSCDILNLYNAGGKTEAGFNKQGEFKWTKAGELCPHLIKVYDEKIKPIFTKEGKIHILRTRKGNNIPTHLDCKEKEVPEFHQKFRLALTGKLDSLYFLDEDNNKIYVPDTYNTYIINGGHPHGLEPADEKLTLCIGSPWTGEESYPNEIYKMNVLPPELKKEWIEW